MNKKNQIRQALVTQSEAVLDARYDLSKDSKRVLMLISQQSGIATSQNNDGWYCVKTSEYSQAFNLSSHESGRDIRGAVQTLWDEKITVYIKDGDNVDELNKRWIIEERKRPAYGEYWIRFHPDLVPYLHDISNNYSHPLEHVDSMKSTHHIRIYDWIYASRASGSVTLDVEFIKNRFKLDLLPAYSRYNNFKRRVIEPAVENINLHTPLTVEYKEIKQGRKVISIQFNILNIPPELLSR
jgi:plasmid replication initiation protein